MSSTKEAVERAKGIKKKLADRVFEIKPDYTYVYGVIGYLESDEECQRVLDYIEDHPDVHISTLLCLALQIDQERQPSEHPAKIGASFNR